jgi:hypothetical protein
VTFEEFQATKFECGDLGAALDQDMGILEPVAGNVYLGSVYIEQVRDTTPNGYPNEYRAQGKWHLLIENTTRIGDDLEKFERELFAWAVGAGIGMPSPEQRSDLEIVMLTREYRAWNEREGLDLGSADDHHDDENLTQAQRDWLKKFSDRWEASAPVHVAGEVTSRRMM